MKVRNNDRTPLKLPVLLFLIAGIPLAVLGYAAWRLVEQDRASERAQWQQRLDKTAVHATQELDRTLSAWEERLAAAVEGISPKLPDGLAVLIFNSKGVVARYGVSLQYYPAVAAPDVDLSEGIFEEVEALEHANPAQATELYRVHAATSDVLVRAGALMRLARSLRNQGQFVEAIRVYGELASMGGTPADKEGTPAELVGHRERMVLFERMGNFASRDREAGLLASALKEGRFLIDAGTFDDYSKHLPGSVALQPSPLADAAWSLWHQWQQPPARAAWEQTGTFVTVWRGTPKGTAALVAPLETLMQSVASAMQEADLRFAIEGTPGHLVWGSSFDNGLESTTTLRDFPWTLRVSADESAVIEASTARRLVPMASFGLMALVIAIAGYVVFRALTRELRVARLQSDFVSAVSHEFRTPLTAMRHLTDMLEEGGVPQHRLSFYYSALGRETRRLHAMVESLLDFARMESGRRAYEMTETNAAELARGLVMEFCEQRHLPPHRVELQPPKTEPRVRADREALSLALRNLLDNAVKYSPESSTVRVSVKTHDGLAGIAVEDQGAGIDGQEQRDIFQKFVRGAAAQTFNVKGTGIGLAMAHEIVKAHGGRIELDSVPRQGSRFTILLPLVTGQTPGNGVPA